MITDQWCMYGKREYMISYSKMISDRQDGGKEETSDLGML
jgi:hypothetical protein